MTDEMTPAQIDARVIKSRQAYAAWRREAWLPWRNMTMMRGIAEIEIGELSKLRDAAPAEKRPKIIALIERWDELRIWTMS